MEITTQELPKSQCNNTDIKNTEFSDTDSIFPSGNGGMMDENDQYQEYFDYFSDSLLSSAGEGIDYQGKVLLNSRAVRLLSYVEDMSGDEKVRTIQSKELQCLNRLHRTSLLPKFFCSS